MTQEGAEGNEKKFVGAATSKLTEWRVGHDSSEPTQKAEDLTAKLASLRRVQSAESNNVKLGITPEPIQPSLDQENGIKDRFERIRKERQRTLPMDNLSEQAQELKDKESPAASPIVELARKGELPYGVAIRSSRELPESQTEHEKLLVLRERYRRHPEWIALSGRLRRASIDQPSIEEAFDKFIKRMEEEDSKKRDFRY